MKAKSIWTLLITLLVAGCAPSVDQTQKSQQVLVYAYNQPDKEYSQHHIRVRALDESEDRIITPPDGAAWNATISLDGDVLYTLYKNDAAQLYRTDLVGEKHERLTNLPGLIAFHPMKSPKSDLIVFSRFDTGNISSFDPETETVTDLAVHEASDRHPVFFSDGQRLLFSSKRLESESGEAGIFILHLATEEIEHTGFYGSYARPSHDGRHIVLAGWEETGAEPDIYIADLVANTRRRRLTETPYYDGHPVFTEDDKSIVFVSRRAQPNTDIVYDDPDTQGINEVFMIPVEGGDWTRLTHGDAVAWHPEIVSVISK